MTRSGAVAIGLVSALLALPLPLAAGGEPEAATAAETRWFQPSSDPMAEVGATLSRAATAGRLALIILGADWCHDSRALAERLQRPRMSGLLAERYETVLIDVGYLDQGIDIVNRFGVPIYYATPTVLIVDPRSERVVNEADRHQWSHAERIGMRESLAYFAQFSASSDLPAPPQGELARLEADIDAYERDMARRVEAGYARLGPLLREYKAGRKPEGFDQAWDELSDFRHAIPPAVQALRNEARARAGAGETDIRLDYPQLPPVTGSAGER